ncbi:TPA: DJ-1/PfpI family protein [Clostridioides difficile]
MITTMGGLSIKPDISLDECTLESKDLLISPGGTTWNEEIHQPILERIVPSFKAWHYCCCNLWCNWGPCEYGMLRY